VLTVMRPCYADLARSMPPVTFPRKSGWREAEGKTHTRTSPGTEVECRGCGSIDVRQEKAIPCWGCVAARLVEGVPPGRTIASTDAVLAGRISILRSRFLCNLRYHPSA
jgi:hypothetical protein